MTVRSAGPRWAALAVAALLVAGCGSDPTPTVAPGTDADGSAADEPVTASPVELPECADWDDERVYSPPAEEQPPTDPDITSPELFRDIEPFDDGGSGMGGFGAAREWAEREASEHFAGLWIDNHHDAAVIAFTDDVDRYAEEVRDRFGAGWWVVEAEHSYAELEQVQASIELTHDSGFDEPESDEPSPRTPPGAIVSTGLLEDRQQVEVMVVGGDDEVLAALAERYDHPAVCFVVLPPPPSYDEDGPVRTLATVPGWREGLERDHPGFALLEIADDREAAERAFTDNVPDDLRAVDGDPSEDGLHAGLDTVDWDRETVVVFSAGRSGSCPVWIEDVRVDDGSVSVTEATPTRGGCTDDYNPFRAVLAVDRDRLPAVDELPLPVNEGFPDGSEAVGYPTG